MKNTNLHAAKMAKNDEFYTRYEDINAEINTFEHGYRPHFENAVVYCNCDDPEWSNFWKFFKSRFHAYKMKKLISTHYEPSGASSYALEYDGERTKRIELEGNGDFRSPECIELLKEADIVVTNPPFSLFREYTAQLIEYEKGFIVIGNKNALTYKETFPLIKDNRVWLGLTSPQEFLVPGGIPSNKLAGLTRWYTNLDTPKRHQPIKLCQRYSDNPSRYPKYDNYDAINVDKVAEIPCDYDGVMGVPITFLDKYCPEQFEVLGLSCTAETMQTPVQLGDAFVKEYKSNGGTGHVSPGMYGVCYHDKNGKPCVPYGRVLIRRRAE